jgi:hypothetical protein
MKILIIAALILLASAFKSKHLSKRKDLSTAGTDVLSVYYCGFG